MVMGQPNESQTAEHDPIYVSHNNWLDPLSTCLFGNIAIIIWVPTKIPITSPTKKIEED